MFKKLVGSVAYSIECTSKSGKSVEYDDKTHFIGG